MVLYLCYNSPNFRTNLKEGWRVEAAAAAPTLNDLLWLVLREALNDDRASFSSVIWTDSRPTDHDEHYAPLS